MDLYPALGLSELCPPKHVQAQVYGGGVQGIHIAFNLNLKIVPIIALSSLFNQDDGKLLKDFAAAFFVGLAQVAP